MNPPSKPNQLRKKASDSAKLTFDNNGLVQQLFGSHHSHLARIEQKLNITADAVGNQITLYGETADVQAGCSVLSGLYARLEKGMDVGRDEVDAVLRMTTQGNGNIADADIQVKTKKRRISPRSPAQADYLRAIDKYELVFGLGPAGTGKTYLAVAKAVEFLVNGEIDRVILSRPAVEAGERLGFLPGDLREKIDPYLRPLYDALGDMLPGEQVVRRMENGDIEVAPLAFMRGRTLSNAFVILDEAQNTTAVQMKMFLTRLGENSRMVVTGDLIQVDLPRGTRSGLRDAYEILSGVKGVAFQHFTDQDVVRHRLVSRIVRAYDGAEVKRRASAPYETNVADDDA